MGIKDLLQKFGAASAERCVRWRVDPNEGLDFIFAEKARINPDTTAIHNPFFGLQYAYLKGLHEQGYAERNSNGYTVRSELVAELDEDFFDIFELPVPYPGKYQVRFEGNTGQAAFAAEIDLILSDGTRLSRYSVEGPFLKLAEGEYYRLSPPEWRALHALRAHTALSVSDRGEYENNWLIFQLQLSKRSGMPINLAHFDNLELVHPEAVGVAVEQLANGDLALSPTYGSDIELKDIKARLGQVRDDESHCILRVKNKFVLLDRARLEATREILTNRRIPKDQVSVFLKSPTAYLSAALIDLDTGFSLRVHGAERFSHRYFGDIEESGIDWFSVGEGLLQPPEKLGAAIDSDDTLTEVGQRIDDARAHNADSLEYIGRTYDISDASRVAAALEGAKRRLDGAPRQDSEFEEAPAQEPATERAVVAIDSNDEESEFTRETTLDGFDPSLQKFITQNLKRTPYPHQNEGIAWLLAHLDLTGSKSSGGGALLADDMGLGKTFMTLVAIDEWFRRCKARGGQEKPVLIVAPLSLMETWQTEVQETFHKSPFSDIVVLQAGIDLPRYRITGSGRETLQEFSDDGRISDEDDIRYSLKVGGVYGSDRLDMPRRLVLTTYQTLRDYQFSLSRVDWSIVAFDEAQNLKNPNTLATRAAKGLKADFKLLATGTPVENSLKDFWCLMDTAIPGLLGAWQSFRTTYISPILAADGDAVRDVKLSIGRTLRETVGNYMLRRTKAEHLQGLPDKTLFTGDVDTPTETYLPVLAGVMSGAQLSHYNQIIESVQSSAAEDRRSIILPSLLRLKITSIHQDIEAKRLLPSNVRDLLREAEQSAKIGAMLSLLREIKGRDEKVIIFATTKAVQAYVCALVTATFGIPVDTVNGDTKAVATKLDLDTRKRIIDRFQAGQGFGVIVMSPVAAGVGLTVVAANNVIHLERHWNPAKEAQATDRVYRIGQTRNVNVYMPMALHPNSRSFDLKLNSLLVNKIDLSDAVVAPSIVESSDLENCFV